MENKKRLIRKMATVTVVVLGLGLVVAFFTQVITQGRRAERIQDAKERQAAVLKTARTDLQELADRITVLPVDPTIVGEVQAKYFEEVARGQRIIWAMSTDGEFLFGVPRESFARLNAAWDAYGDSIVSEGVFVDRQDFLRHLVHASDRLRPGDLAPDPDDPEAPWSRLRDYADPEDWRVFSVPLRAADGAALGNLYLKMEIVDQEEDVRAAPVSGDVVAAATTVSGLAGTFLWFLLPTWVYVDARERGARRALLWSFLVLISLAIGFVVYLIVRPEATTLRCPGCEREVNGGAYCPHCGCDLSSAFCSACRYPLKPDWVFCPSCRTETGRTGMEARERLEAPPPAGDEPPPENG